MNLHELLKRAAGRPLPITREHLKAGQRKFPEKCPLTLALRQGLGLPKTAQIRVQHPRTFLILEGQEAKLSHDPLLHDWLQLIDRPGGPAKSPVRAVKIEMRWTPKGEMRPQLLLIAPAQTETPAAAPPPPRRRGRPPKKDKTARRRQPAPANKSETSAAPAAPDTPPPGLLPPPPAEPAAAEPPF